MLTATTPLDARLRAAIRDDATAYRGVAWVRRQFALGHYDAYAAIESACRRLGRAEVLELKRKWKITKLLAVLAAAEEKWPGILHELGNNPHRAVADGRKMERWETWRIVKKGREAMGLSGASWREVVVRAIGNKGPKA